eukprot:1105861-Amphidinium_carterae.1
MVQLALRSSSAINATLRTHSACDAKGELTYHLREIATLCWTGYVRANLSDLHHAHTIATFASSTNLTGAAIRFVNALLRQVLGPIPASVIGCTGSARSVNVARHGLQEQQSSKSDCCLQPVSFFHLSEKKAGTPGQGQEGLQHEERDDQKAWQA